LALSLIYHRNIAVTEMKVVNWLNPASIAPSPGASTTNPGVSSVCLKGSGTEKWSDFLEIKEKE